MQNFSQGEAVTPTSCFRATLVFPAWIANSRCLTYRWVHPRWWKFESYWKPEEPCLLRLTLLSGLNKVFVKRYFAGQGNVNELVTSHASPQIPFYVDDCHLCSEGQYDRESEDSGSFLYWELGVEGVCGFWS